MNFIFWKKFNYAIKVSFIPVLLFALTCFLICAFSPFPKEVINILHYLLYFFILADISVLIYYNKSYSLWPIILVFISYIIYINTKAINDGIFFLSEPAYVYTTVLLPVNLCVFSFFSKNDDFFSKRNLYLLLFFLCEFAIFENLCLKDINIFKSETIFCLNTISFSIFLYCTLVFLFRACKEENFSAYIRFFCATAIFLAFLFSAQISVVCMFFLFAVITCFFRTLYDIKYAEYFDKKTGVFNKNSYMKHVEKIMLSNIKKINTKAANSVICITKIDNYNQLRQTISKRQFENLLKMAVSQIASLSNISEIYRIDNNIFMLIIYERDMNTSYNLIDDVRRKIASYTFVLKRKKELKITITSVITENGRGKENTINVISKAFYKLKSSLSENITLQS